MRKIRNRLLRHTYLITLVDGTAFSGVLDEADREYYVLLNVKLLQNDGLSVDVDNKLILERAKVLYVQLLGN